MIVMMTSLAGLYKATNAPQGTGSATDVMAPAKLNIINQGKLSLQQKAVVI